MNSKRFWTHSWRSEAVVSMTHGTSSAVQKTASACWLSSIAQAGYTLVVDAALQGAWRHEQAVAAIAFTCSFHVHEHAGLRREPPLHLRRQAAKRLRLAGLSRRNPMLALAMTIALPPLGGVPPARASSVNSPLPAAVNPIWSGWR